MVKRVKEKVFFGPNSPRRKPLVVTKHARRVPTKGSTVLSPLEFLMLSPITAMTFNKERRVCSNPACANRASVPDLNAMVRYFASLRKKGVIDDQQYYELTRLAASRILEREVECLVTDKLDQVIFQKFSSSKLLEALTWA